MSDPTKPKRKVGRPAIVIDWDRAETLYSIGCTDNEVANRLGINARTMRRRRKKLDEVRDNGETKLKVGLRRKMIEIAMSDGHKAQAKCIELLAKNKLNFSERVQVSVDESLKRLADLLGEQPEDVRLDE